MRRYTNACLLVVLLIVLAACGSSGTSPDGSRGPTTSAEGSAGPEQPSSPPEAPKDVSVRLGWVAVGYDAPVVLAYREGWFEEAGLNVTIGEGSGSTTVAKLIGNKSDDIGHIDSGAASLAISEGVPIKVIGSMLQQSPLATIYRNDSGITEPTDLEGKNWGVAPGSAATQLQPVFLQNAGINLDNVNMVGMDGSAYVQSLLSGRIDAFDSYALEQLPIINTGLDGEASAFEWADYGLNVLGLGVIVHVDTISEDPEMLSTYMQVLARGWEAAVDDPRRAAEALLAEYPNAGAGNVEVVQEQLERSIEKLHTTNSEGQPLLWMADEDWEDTQDTLFEFGDLKETRPIEEYFTNDFIWQD